MTAGIYKITHNTSGRFYIGSARNIRSRWAEHRRELSKGVHHNKYLQRVWNKHGHDSLLFEVVEEVVNLNELLEREQFWMNTLNPQFNHCKSARNRLGSKHSEETRKKISESNKGKKMPKEWKELMKKIHVGRKNSPEVKAKMSAAYKPREVSAEAKFKMGATNRGKRLSEETKKKIVISTTGKVRSKEHCLNISRAKTGKPIGPRINKGVSHHLTSPRTRWVELNGERLCFKEACEKLGVSIKRADALRRYHKRTHQEMVDYYVSKQNNAS